MGAFAAGGGFSSGGSGGGISPAGASGLSGVSGNVSFGDFARNMLMLRNGISPSHWEQWKAQHQGGAQTSTQTDPMRAFKGMQPPGQMPQPPGQMPQYGSPNMLGRLQTSPY